MSSRPPSPSASHDAHMRALNLTEACARVPSHFLDERGAAPPERESRGRSPSPAGVSVRAYLLAPLLAAVTAVACGPAGADASGDGTSERGDEEPEAELESVAQSLSSRDCPDPRHRTSCGACVDGVKRCTTSRTKCAWVSWGWGTCNYMACRSTTTRANFPVLCR